MTDYSKITALYSRLSVGDEDRDGGESNSIQNQKIFLENYARGQHLTNIRHYIDDDESGRFFDRSAYSRMMDDVENGKIGVCIMKDLTRWGRDYLQVGKPDRHYEHKQYAFDSYCKKVLKCEACNGYRQISRHQKRFTSLEELSEAEMAQLAVYDRYPWEYTTFPVGGVVILIEDDGLAEALLGLSQEDREIFMMHWFLRMTDAQIARYINMPRRTVNTRRHKAYRLLTELMGGEADD